MPQWLVFGQYKIKRRSSIILADVKLWNPDSPIPHKPVLLESPTLDSVQSLLLRCDGAAGFPWRSSPPEVGLLKTQQRLSTCPSRVGAFISCCSIPNRLSWPFFIFGLLYLSRLLKMPCAVLSCFSRVQLCNPMDCSLPGSSVHGDSPGKNTGMGCHALSKGAF